MFAILDDCGHPSLIGVGLNRPLQLAFHITNLDEAALLGDMSTGSYR